jgi:protease I
MTSWREVAPEVREAGGVYVDEPAVEDGQFITARKPGDMPIQLRRIFEILEDRAIETADE